MTRSLSEGRPPRRANSVCVCLRVASEILAYQDYAAWAWKVLPGSALKELTAVTLFAINLVLTFLRPPVVVPTPLSMTTK
jgi:hypothetical protein